MGWIEAGCGLRATSGCFEMIRGWLRVHSGLARSFMLRVYVHYAKSSIGTILERHVAIATVKHGI
jgi:hypothetical protein